ncbi:MAG: hypothetical protein P8Z36_17555, partial [Gemmatimonadota bacterium]
MTLLSNILERLRSLIFCPAGTRLAAVPRRNWPGNGGAGGGGLRGRMWTGSEVNEKGTRGVMMRTFLVVFGLSLTLVAASTAQEPGPYTFLTISRGDTVASEVVRRTPTSVASEMV